MNKQLGSTLSTTINGTRSCYIATNRFAFLSVETLLGRSVHICNTILNGVWTLFKNVKQMTRKRKSFDLQKEYCAPGTQTRIADLDNRSCREVEKSFCAGKVYRTLCIWTIHVPNENNSAIVIPTIRGECATHRSFSQKRHTCEQQIIDSCRDV